MSVELYHFEPNANGGKPIMALLEKGVTFTSHWVDLLNFEQHQPAYLAINPKGQVPTLVHDGMTITESTPMCEYIEEAFEGPSLRPADALGRARMRAWARYGDEFLGPSLSMIGWSTFIAPMMREREKSQIDKAMEAIPTEERRRAWAKTFAGDFAPEEIAESFRRIGIAALRMEHQLSQTPWLAGESFSIADIVLFNMSGAMPMMLPDTVNPGKTPHLLDWMQRTGSRPAIRQALAYSRNSLRGPQQ
ncbi:glutathione S-transferase family protein [Altererythrobacter sp.]|uniref:glutathione S-transferase family protein n=1 Tax=Altererythrobacter sp. TaxID=1872480 RepID=UPI003D01ACD1